MKDYPVLFLASTNLPWTLDPAIIRRFSKVIPIDLPKPREKLEIFKQCLKDHDLSGLDLKALAHNDTDDFSGISSEDCQVPVCDYKAKSGRSLDDQNPKADALLQPPEEGALMASTSVFVLEPGEQVGEY